MAAQLLEDAAFTIRIELPGDVERHNADAVDGGALVWSLDLPWDGKTSCGPPILMMQTSWHRLAVDSLARHPLHRLASLRRVERQ